MKKNLMQIGTTGIANKNNILKLKDYLIRLNKADCVNEELKEEGLEIIKSINPLELSLAEQRLIEDGMKPNELRNFCDIHIEALGGELENLKANIEKGHLLATLIQEHEVIDGNLIKLESINSKIQKKEEVNEILFEELFDVITMIIGAEPHHKREEDVLFIELEKLGVTGPTRIMRLEHDTMRMKKHEIANIAKNYKEDNIENVKILLDDLVKSLVHELKDHIFKENYILYPTAFNTIKSVDKWNEMKLSCDEIGYCSFTKI